ncbi:MAG: proton-conducting transporter membrane subunit [Pseudomonadota bacterium]
MAIPLLVGLVFLFLDWSIVKNFSLMLSTVSVVTVLSAVALTLLFKHGPILRAANGWFVLDYLSAYHLMIMVLVYLVISIYTLGYFRGEIHEYQVTNRRLSQFNALWLLSFGSMLTVLLSNNIAIMWVGVEATTLFTTFLICFHKTKNSLEAMWKYILICSVGVALAFIGITFITMSSSDSMGNDILFWTYLMEKAEMLNPGFVKIGFIFIVVGYGTKAGLAPMHNWLPDAHGQAPSPVSAMFSGLMLNIALYGVSRFLPIVEISTGKIEWALSILRLIGLTSMVVAAAFIAYQKDLKRLLAYSSVEHMGIIAFALGMGKEGAFFALFHTFNHSFAKTLAFLSAGRLIQTYKTQNISEMNSILKISPLWGMGLVTAMLTLVGMAPFSIFVSKFYIAKIALGKEYWIGLAIFLISTATIFIVLLKNIIGMAWGRPKAEYLAPINSQAEYIIVGFIIFIVFTLGLWLPAPLAKFMGLASLMITGV